MNILMLTPYLPYPPASGGQVRSLNLLKYLSQKHKITLYSLIKDEEERKYIPKLKQYCQKICVFTRPRKPWSFKNILKTGFSVYPFLVVRNTSDELKKEIAKELYFNTYDLIHAECFYVMPHLPQTNIPIVLVDQTIEFQVYQHFIQSLKNPFVKLFLSPILYLDVYKIKYWELKFWQKAKRVIAVSEADKKKMISFIPSLRVDVVPNGAGEDLMNVWSKREISVTPSIFFQANFDWLQNVEAANNLIEKVYPLVQKKDPKIECWIVGQKAKEKMGKILTKGIKVIDLDNADIEGVIAVYRKATVFVAPLEGPGGTRLKILGAMAAGIPVVTTKIGIEGIDATDGQHVIIADNWENMAQKTVDLINDRDLYRKISLNARKLVEDKYSYKSIAEILDRIYQEVINNERIK